MELNSKPKRSNALSNLAVTSYQAGESQFAHEGLCIARRAQLHISVVEEAIHVAPLGLWRRVVRDFFRIGGLAAAMPGADPPRPASERLVLIAAPVELLVAV